jgi:hypothetical protein
VIFIEPPDFASALLEWKRKSADPTGFTGLELVFPSHVVTTARCRPGRTANVLPDVVWLRAQSVALARVCGAGAGVWCRQAGAVPNGGRLPLHDERWGVAGKYESVGWHTFRHTYRSWLDDTGAPMGVQQRLMRHAQISTTMNVYGNALMEAKRETNTTVVRKALRTA